MSEEIYQSGTYDWYSILYSNYLNSHVVYTRLCRCTTSVNILNVILEKKLQFITLLTAICIVSHIENSKNYKGYIT